MQALWSEGRPMTSVEILDVVAGKRPAQTTLLTALERLSRKGLVRRVGDAARKVQFEAALTEAEHASQTMIQALPEADSRGAALLKFAGDLDPADLALLQQAITERKPSDSSKKRR